jgi:pseudomonalisin
MLARRILAALSATTLIAMVFLTGALRASAAPAPTTRLAADVVPGLAQLAPAGATAPGQSISVDVVIADPDPAGEQALLNALYTKGSPEYHQFLTPGQYAARFAVAPAQEAAVETFAASHGLTVQRVNAMRDLVVLTGTVAQAERTFGVAINDYVWHGLHFYANTVAPAVPSGLGIVGVVGLNSAQRMWTTNQAPPASAPHGPTPAQDTCDPTGSVCVGITTPNDIRSVYDAPAANEGQGETMAVFGEGDFTDPISNLRLFENHFSLPEVPVKVILADGPNLSKYSDTSGDVEWDLDTQAETGVAPEVQGLDLYFGTSLTDQDVANMFSVWADDPSGPTQANASFGECEYDPVAQQLPSGDDFAAGQAFTQETEQILTQANGEGRTLFASAGDTGSSCPILPVDVNGVANQAFPDVNYPCASPHAVCVGGTVLYTKGGDTEASPNPAEHATRVLEYSWTFTGGGTSFLFPKPAYQDGVSAVDGFCLYDTSGNPAPPGTACRGVPDVAAQSGDVLTNGYSIYSGGSLGEEGGTSLSSPLNVGMWTLDQAASAKGNGFADPSFYAHPSDFFDIGGGASSPPTSDGYYVSAPGWDYLSGLGVQDIAKLMKDLDGTTTPVNDVASPNTGTWEAVDPTTGSVVATGGGSSSGAGQPVGVVACEPLFTGPPNAASYPPEAPQSTPQLDILQGDMHLSADGKTLRTILTIQDMETGATAVAQPGGANEYYMTWTFNGKSYFTNAEVSAVGVSYNYGTVTLVGSTHSYQPTGSATGSVVAGPNGTVEIDVPLSDVGSPTAGNVLTAPSGQTYVEVGAPTVGGLLESVDTAGPQNDYTLGEVCSATGLPGSDGGAGPSGGTVPEVPFAAALPVVGLAVAGGLVLRRRRRTRRPL